jgi:hypothetical protein
VFYAAASEILPDATHKGTVWTIVLGGTLGIVTMLTIRRFTLLGASHRRAKTPSGQLMQTSIIFVKITKVEAGGPAQGRPK